MPYGGALTATTAVGAAAIDRARPVSTRHRRTRPADPLTSTLSKARALTGGDSPYPSGEPRQDVLAMTGGRARGEAVRNAD